MNIFAPRTRNAAILTRGAEAPPVKLADGQELPMLFRSFEVVRAEIDETNRIVPCVFATENPVRSWFGSEILRCDSKSVRLDRMQRLGAFLSEHDRQRQIGVIVGGSIEFGVDRRGRAKVRFSKANPLAEQEWRDVLDGIRGLFSVGYIVHKYEVDEDEEIYTAIDWEPLEISLVSVPADIECEVGRADANSQKQDLTTRVCVIKSHARENSQNSETQTENPDEMKRRTMQFFPPDNGGNNGGPGNGGATTAAPVAPETRSLPATPEQIRAAAKEASDTEVARVRELAALGERYNCRAEMDKLIAENKPAADGLRFVMENRMGNPAPVQTPVNGGGAGGASAVNGYRTIGEMLTNDAAFKTLAGGKGSRRNHTFDFPGVSYRTTLAIGAGAGNASVTAYDRQPGIVLVEQQRLTIADLLAPGTTALPTIRYMREVTFTNAATTVAQGAEKPEAAFTLEEADSAVRKIAVVAKVTDEMFADFPTVRSYVDFRLPFMVEQEEEDQLLNGDGVAPNILGLLNTVGIQTQAMGADTSVDAVHKAITKVRTVGFFEPTGIILHPNDWQEMKLSKDANGQYFAGGPFMGAYGQAMVLVERLWGLPVVVTTAITEGTGLVGAFKTAAQIFRREGVTLETTNSNEDDFKKNLIAIRAEERLALCVYRPLAFCTVTGI